MDHCWITGLWFDAAVRTFVYTNWELARLKSNPKVLGREIHFGVGSYARGLASSPEEGRLVGDLVWGATKDTTPSWSKNPTSPLASHGLHNRQHLRPKS